MIFVLIGSQLTLAALGLLARRADDGPRKGSIIQSNVRWNTFVGLSIASALFGEAGLALMAIAVAVLTPTANVISVLALTHFANDDGKKKPHVMMDMICSALRPPALPRRSSTYWVRRRLRSGCSWSAQRLIWKRSSGRATPL